MLMILLQGSSRQWWDASVKRIEACSLVGTSEHIGGCEFCYASDRNMGNNAFERTDCKPQGNQQSVPNSEPNNWSWVNEDYLHITGWQME